MEIKISFVKIRKKNNVSKKRRQQKSIRTTIIGSGSDQKKNIDNVSKATKD